MKTEDKTLVWLPTELAKMVESAQSDEQLNAIIEVHFTDSLREIKAELDALDYNVLQYKALMAKARIAFTEAATEAIEKSYEVWEAFDEKMPSIDKKIQKGCDALNPLLSALDAVNAKIAKIDLYKLERLTEILNSISELDHDAKYTLFEIMKRESES